eukprot:scaffold71328_cov20-Prasinocladus_malaysianus.AAC.1
MGVWIIDCAERTRVHWSLTYIGHSHCCKHRGCSDFANSYSYYGTVPKHRYQRRTNRYFSTISRIAARTQQPRSDQLVPVPKPIPYECLLDLLNTPARITGQPRQKTPLA